jgi:hypothetical protein
MTLIRSADGESDADQHADCSASHTSTRASRISRSCDVVRLGRHHHRARVGDRQAVKYLLLMPGRTDGVPDTGGGCGGGIGGDMMTRGLSERSSANHQDVGVQ